MARHLRNVQNLPLDEIGIWLCIAEKANYSTSLLGPLNSEGNRNHGILQINDKYWCGPGSCNVDCSKLLDGDITDDLMCGKIIVAETQKYSPTKDGFTAWPIYTTRCKENAKSYIDGCFEQRPADIVPPPTIPMVVVRPDTTGSSTAANMPSIGPVRSVTIPKPQSPQDILPAILDLTRNHLLNNLRKTSPADGQNDNNSLPDGLKLNFNYNYNFYFNNQSVNTFNF